MLPYSAIQFRLHWCFHTGVKSLIFNCLRCVDFVFKISSESLEETTFQGNTPQNHEAHTKKKSLIIPLLLRRGEKLIDILK